MRLLLVLLILSALQLSAQPAQFQVNKFGTNATIDEAINFATNIWSQQLSSSQPIVINLTYTNMTALGPLGITFPNGEINFAVAPLRDVWYPSCLANKLMGWDLQPANADMDIYINSFHDWYFGTDGNPSAFQYDFVSVLLHEIGHGLGFLSLAKVNNDGNGSFGKVRASDFAPLAPSFPFPNLDGKPSAIDYWLKNSGGDVLTDTNLFPNISAALAAELTSGSVWYHGSEGMAANGSARVKMYAPGSFALGTSITHLNESTYPAGGGNSLMTPFIDQGEVENEIGGIVLGIFEDIGWTIVPSAVSRINSDEDKARFSPNPFTSMARLDISLHKAGDVQIELFDVLGRELYQSTEKDFGPGKHQLILKGSHFPEGTLIYRVTMSSGVISGKLFHQKKAF